MGRPASAGVVNEFETARRRGRGKTEQMATETFEPGPDRRARSNRVRSWADVRLRAHNEERCFREAGSRFGQEILSGRQELPAQLRTVGRRFSFAVFG